MKVKFIDSCICNGDPVKVGDVVDLSDADAKSVVEHGLAEFETPPEEGHSKKKK